MILKADILFFGLTRLSVSTRTGATLSPGEHAPLCTELAYKIGPKLAEGQARGSKSISESGDRRGRGDDGKWPRHAGRLATRRGTDAAFRAAGRSRQFRSDLDEHVCR